MENFEKEVTEIVKGYITAFLQVSIRRGRKLTVQEYTANPAEKWKSKDTAIYLLTSIASRGSTHQVRPNLLSPRR